MAMPVGDAMGDVRYLFTFALIQGKIENSKPQKMTIYMSNNPF